MATFTYFQISLLKWFFEYLSLRFPNKITNHRLKILCKSCFHFFRQTWRLRCTDGALKFLNKDNIEARLLFMAEHEFRKVRVLLQAVNFTN